VFPRVPEVPKLFPGLLTPLELAAGLEGAGLDVAAPAPLGGEFAGGIGGAMLGAAAAAGAPLGFVTPDMLAACAFALKTRAIATIQLPALNDIRLTPISSSFGGNRRGAGSFRGNGQVGVMARESGSTVALVAGVHDV
jgi:hypothetical protein